MPLRGKSMTERRRRTLSTIFSGTIVASIALGVIPSAAATYEEHCFNHLLVINCLFVTYDVVATSCTTNSSGKTCDLSDGGDITHYHWVNAGAAVVDPGDDSCVSRHSIGWLGYTPPDTEYFGCEDGPDSLFVPTGTCQNVTRSILVTISAESAPANFEVEDTITVCA